ncbi:MAG TPA: hypothetical protein DDX19_03200 [Rhodopirellula baltica]|nr:hypothetical protein [Rhodopirellula baltica]
MGPQNGPIEVQFSWRVSLGSVCLVWPLGRFCDVDLLGRYGVRFGSMKAKPGLTPKRLMQLM